MCFLRTAISGVPALPYPGSRVQNRYLPREARPKRSTPTLLHGALTPLFAWICLLVIAALIEGGCLFKFGEIKSTSVHGSSCLVQR